MVYRTLTAVVLLAFMCSCASHTPPRWEYEQDAITIHLSADAHLNFYDDTSHTLPVCIYQLGDLAAINKASADPDGIARLQGCSIDDAGATVARMLIVHPDQEVNVTLDRESGVQFITVIAGYPSLLKDMVVRSYRIPVKKKGIHRKPVPRKITLSLVLGPEQILSP